MTQVPEEDFKLPEKLAFSKQSAKLSLSQELSTTTVSSGLPLEHKRPIEYSKKQQTLQQKPRE